MAESAFIIDVPEAESIASTVRAQLGSSSDPGIPAHITVLYPFMPPELITADVVQAARDAVFNSRLSFAWL
jgi:hypothetical protein